MSKRQRQEAAATVAVVRRESPDVIRWIGKFLTWEEYTFAAETCRHWRSALKRDLDLKRPWFATVPSYLREDVQLDSDIPDKWDHENPEAYFSLAASALGPSTAVTKYLDLDKISIVSYRFRKILVGLDPANRQFESFGSEPKFYIDFWRGCRSKKDRRRAMRLYRRERPYRRDYVRRFNKRYRGWHHMGRLRLPNILYQ